MASTTPLQLFPAPHRTAVPRKSSLKKPPKTSDSPVAPGELRGVAIQVSPPSAGRSSPSVQPADDHIKHSLFCDVDSSGSSQYIQARPQRRVRRRSSASEPSNNSGPTRASAGNEDSDHVTPLPLNTKFGRSASRSPPRHPSANLKRPTVPVQISTEVLPDCDLVPSPRGDKLFPLPTKDSFGMSPLRAEYPSPASARSGSPTLVRSNSGASTSKRAWSPQQQHSAPARSIFPQYDHTRAFQEQQYYPNTGSPTPTLPSDKVSKLGSPDFERPKMERFDSAVALVDGYEHIAVANHHDMVALWNASSDIFPCAGRKVQLGLHQPSASGTSLGIGSSPDQLLYSMNKEAAPSLQKDAPAQRDLAVTKYCPQKDLTDTVAQMGLPDPARSTKEREKDVVTIFPQMAAFCAIEAASKSAAASEIAQFDPTASGPEAKRLAQDAVSDARRRFRCELVRATRKRDSLGAVTATYRLEHPALGPFAITVTKSTAGGRHARDPRAKISLHHPSATPAAVSAENLVLATLDFARNACVLDTPGLLALEGPHVIDTVICALLAVAVVENDALMEETITFDAPPTAPITASTPKNRSSLQSSEDSSNGRRWWGGKSKKKSKKQLKKEKKEAEGQVELPLATEAALGLLGLAFKGTVFALQVGVKVGAGVIIGTTHLVRKL